MQQENFSTLVAEVGMQQIPGYTLYNIWRKLHILAQKSGQLQREYSTMEKTMIQLRLRLQGVQDEMLTNLFNQELIMEERELIKELEKWESVNERVMIHKSRAIWIKHGDRNSIYFLHTSKLDKQGT